MFVSNTFIQTFCFIIFVTKVLGSRKYDIEAEALKLYKEDIKTVLQHFRRTPDYLKILEDKTQEFISLAKDVMKQLLFHYTDQLTVKVREMMGVPATKGVETPPPSTTPASALLFRNGRVQRRLDDSTTPSPIEVLDTYSKLSSSLSLAQRNALKELGFTYAGYVIHGAIKNLGTDADGQIKSTKHPSGGNQNDKEVTTTEHVSVHTVTGSTKHATTEESTPEDGAAKEALKEGEQDLDPVDNDTPTFKHQIKK